MEYIECDPPLPERYTEVMGMRSDWPWWIAGKLVWLKREEDEPDEADCN